MPTFEIPADGQWHKLPAGTYFADVPNPGDISDTRGEDGEIFVRFPRSDDPSRTVPVGYKARETTND